MSRRSGNNIALIKLLAASILLSLTLIAAAYPQAAQERSDLKVLLIDAHPDDESVYSATVYKITHDLKGKVDIVLITNGEGGYKYSTLAEDVYGAEITEEKVGRDRLPTIRKRETMNAGAVIGIRNYYFLEQKDNKYTQDVQEVFQGIWDIENVKKRLNEIVMQGGYDYIFTLLPTPDTHGHHKAATILALETVKNFQGPKKPIILGTTLQIKDSQTKFEFAGLESHPITKISKTAPVFTFDRTQKFGFNDALNYKVIANWLIAEHKSQGALQMGMNYGDMERYYYYDVNNESGIEPTNRLFEQLKVVTFKKKTY